MVETHQQGLPEVLGLAGILIGVGKHEVVETVIFLLLVLHEQGMLHRHLAVALVALHGVGHEAQGEGLALGRELSHLMDCFVNCHSANLQTNRLTKKDTYRLAFFSSCSS